MKNDSLNRYLAGDECRCIPPTEQGEKPIKRLWKHPEDWKSYPLVGELKKYFGCKDDYFPETPYRVIVDNMAREYTMEAPTDTSAVEQELDAIMGLIRSGGKEELKLAHEFADVLMRKKNVKHENEDRLKKMQETFKLLLGREEDTEAK